MPMTQQELGRRIRAAREACGMTQEKVALELGVSRPTMVQIELGNRAITSIELDKLAYLLGRDIREFLAEEFTEEDALVALFRAHPDVEKQEGVVETLRRCFQLGREITNLERLLGIHRDLEAVATYRLPAPRSKWEAVQQGARVSEEERRRLGLGIAPVANVPEAIETQGIHVAQINLPDDVSGVTLREESVGLFVIVNECHSFLRRRFSYAHEYAHVLFDQERLGTISREENRDDRLEIRANAFAANFLMPGAGVQQFISAVGKGSSRRRTAAVFDGSGVVRASSNRRSRGPEMQMYDVIHLAHYFGVSRLATLYRLRNLELINQAQLERLKEQEEGGLGVQMADVLDLTEPKGEKAKRNDFRHRFITLGLEALRRQEITYGKLKELAEMVELESKQLEYVIKEANLGDDLQDGDVLLPKG